MRRLAPLCAFVAMLVAASVVNADTIYLKNGSVIKGKVTSFSDDQFVILLNTGSDRFTSRAQIYIGDVARIEFDAMSLAGGEGGPAPTVTAHAVEAKNEPTPPRDENTGPARDSGTSAVHISQSTEPKDKPVATEPPHEAQPQESSANPARDTENPQPAVTAAPPAAEPDADSAPPMKSKGPVKTATVDVIAKRDWTSSGLIVRRGDRIRIRANGVVTLDPNSNVTSGPEGIDQQDPKKLMQDKPTGALIAVIGADNDDFIFIGKTNEFTAARDGLLFLSVNEGTLSDNSGAFKATIEIASAGR